MSAFVHVPSFPLGSIFATPGVLEACSHEHLLRCLSRHARSDWGTVCAEDAKANDEADRSVTTLLLPDEY